MAVAGTCLTCFHPLPSRLVQPLIQVLHLVPWMDVKGSVTIHVNANMQVFV